MLHHNDNIIFLHSPTNILPSSPPLHVLVQLAYHTLPSLYYTISHGTPLPLPTILTWSSSSSSVSSFLQAAITSKSSDTWSDNDISSERQAHTSNFSPNHYIFLVYLGCLFVAVWWSLLCPATTGVAVLLRLKMRVEWESNCDTLADTGTIVNWESSHEVIHLL